MRQPNSLLPPGERAASPTPLRALLSKGPIRLLIALGCLAALTIAALTALIVWQQREREIATARRNLGAFDTLLAEQTARAMQGVELVIQDVVDDEVTANAITTAEEFNRLRSDEELYKRLQQRTMNIPQLDAITLNSADGRLINFSRYFPIPDVDISDREYFHALHDHPAEKFYFSTPTQNRGDGTWDIYVALRVNGLHGEFIGMVMGAMRLTYFEDLYKEVSVGGTTQGGPIAIALWRSDGTLLIRYPQWPPVGPAAEPRHMVRISIQPGQTAVTVRPATAADPERLVATHLLDSGQLVVNVVQSMDSVLADWRHDSVVIIVAGVGGVIATLLVMAVLLRQFATYEAMSRAIEAREEAVQARQLAEDRLGAANKLEAIGRLTSGVAHDFNNLLTSIIANTELLLRDRSTGAAASRRLSVVMQAADRGANLIRQLLAFSRQQVLEPTSVDLNGVIGGMQELLRSTLGEGIVLRLRLGGLVWPALVDAIQIEHLILNLAINARDAMADGGRLSIATANATAGHPDRPSELPRGEYVIISVSDTGTGMSDELQQKVFEPFFTTKPPGKGSGLGLSQVYGLAHQSGGTVQLQSQPGQGTTVKVFLPRALAAHLPTAEADPAAAPVPPAHDARLVLIVDDDAAVRDTLASILSESGFSVSAADGGALALRDVEGGLRPDVVLLDRSMPEMDGLALAKALRARLGSVPIVFMTGDTASLSGERWVLEKPFVGRTLTKILQEAMDQKAAAAG
jgi:signal transduction histidine kinase